MSEEFLKEFFAVTSGGVSRSLYHVFLRHDGIPRAKKLRLQGRSKCDAGSEFGNDNTLSIGKYLTWYHTLEERCRIEDVSVIGASTSAVVGLFLSEEEAHKCFEADDLQSCDMRFLEHTQATLALITEDHPKFVITHFHYYALIREEKVLHRMS